MAREELASFKVAVPKPNDVYMNTMPNRTVYLAGGITGLTLAEAMEWRQQVADRFPAWLKALSPLRSKEYLKDEVGNGVVKDSYTDHIMSTPKGITTRDRNDCMRADAILVNFLGAKKASIGTVMEIAWGDAFRKPIIVAMEPDNIHNHSMIRESVGWITPSLEEAADIVVKVLGCGC